MSGWTKLSLAEIERRRAESVAALREADRKEFEHWYQQEIDRLYWSRGKCCAGCDNWQSEMGLIGYCAAAGIVSGEDVLRSMGITFSSYMPPPGLPSCEATFYCGKFQDGFDWSILDREYLAAIGAVRDGVLRDKPQSPIAREV